LCQKLIIYLSDNSMSKYSMKNIREISKENTRNLILERTLQLIFIQGVINTSTKQIADACNLAHGTIFAHFKNREELIGSVIKSELIRIAEKLYQISEQKSPFDKLLDEYLKLIVEEEELFVVINKEFPFLSDYLKNEIISTETIVKKFFYNTILAGIDEGSIKKINISVLISCIFGIISHYLVRKEYFVSSGSVIMQKKNEIIKLVLNLINQ
jgi:AcrR family transcriptional regulator